MHKLISIVILVGVICLTLHAQNTGIGTSSPQAKLDVNGTFKLQQGVFVNLISTDTAFSAASDQILPTQLAVRKYLESGLWVPGYQTADSALIFRDSLANQQTLIWVAMQGNFAYALRANSGLYIYDFSNPDSITARGGTTTNMNSPLRVFVQGDYAYVTSFGNDQLNIYDISNPDNIIALGTTNQNLSGPWGIYVEGDYAYVGSFNNDRLCIFNISNPNNIIAVSFITHASMDGPEMVWKQGNFVWVTSQFGGGTGYLHRFDVSNPTSPVLKGFSNQNLNKPHDVQTSGTYALVTSQQNNQLVIFDGSDPNTITPVASLSGGLVHPNHLSINGKFAYVTSADQNSNIRQIDITDPLNPQLRPQVLSGISNTNAAVCASGHFLSIAGASNHALWLYDLQPLQDDRRVTIHSDGTFSYDFGVWQFGHQVKADGTNFKHYDLEALVKEQQRIIYRTEGNVGIRTASPQCKLHVDGDQKFNGGYDQYLEFGSGIEGKNINAGKIYYNRNDAGTSGYTDDDFDILNIVGGGTDGHRRIKLWADEVTVTGPLVTTDSLIYAQKAFYGEGAWMQKQVGIFSEPGIMPLTYVCAPNGYAEYYTYKDNLVLQGVMRILDNGAESGLYLNPYNSANDQSFYFGMKDANIFGIRRLGSWPLQINTTDGHVGIIAAPDPVFRLKVGRHFAVWGDLKVNGEVRSYANSGVDGSGYLEFGAGIVTKHPQNGLIYQANSGELLITGAGPDTTTRKIKLWSEAGLEMNSDLQVAGNINATAMVTQPWEDLSASMQNGWVDYGGGYVEAAYYKDPAGVVHFRGLIKNGLNQQNTLICTLPPAYRPAYGHLIFAVVNGVNTLGRIDVESDGDVVFRGSTNAFLSLDQIEFRTF